MNLKIFLYLRILKNQIPHKRHLCTPRNVVQIEYRESRKEQDNSKILLIPGMDERYWYLLHAPPNERVWKAEI